MKHPCEGQLASGALLTLNQFFFFNLQFILLVDKKLKYISKTIYLNL